jgi:hypothetical protein
VEPLSRNIDPDVLRLHFFAFMVERLSASGTEGKIVGPVLRDAVLDAAVEALHDEFIQGGMKLPQTGLSFNRVRTIRFFCPHLRQRTIK